MLFRDAAHVRPQALPQFRREVALMMFRAENAMVMGAGVGVAHDWDWGSFVPTGLSILCTTVPSTEVLGYFRTSLRDYTRSNETELTE